MPKLSVSKDVASGKETWCHFDGDGKMVFESNQNLG